MMEPTLLLPKIKFLILALIVIFAPVEPVVTTIVVLCILDLVVGYIASKKPFNSRDLKRTPIKIAVYLTAVCAAFLVEQYLSPLDFPFIMKAVAGLIGMTELKSVLENLDTIAGGSFFQSLVNSIQSRASRPEEEDHEEVNPPEPPKTA